MRVIFLKKRLSVRNLLLASLLVAFAFFIVSLYVDNTNGYARQQPSVHIKVDPTSAREQCHRPVLDPFAPNIIKFIRKVTPLICSEEANWLIFDRDFVKLNPKYVKGHESIRCEIKYMARDSDFASSRGQTQVLAFNQRDQADLLEVRLKSDFFWTKCSSQWSKQWSNVMANVHRSEAAINRIEELTRTELETSNKINFLMFGLDSMSRVHYQRKLPLTYNYLTKDLEAIVLKGYNIVGDGTPQALIPILTGFTEPELPETRKRKFYSNYVNAYPFIWNNFSSAGYVTLFAEDTPETGIFTYRLKGFDKVPTDHYMRQFYVEAIKEINNHPKLCFGDTPRHLVMMNYVSSLFDVYPKEVAKFAFGFSGELSHDDFNLVEAADQDLVDWLKGMKSKGHLDNTILVMMADHGHRFAKIRGTQQGKLEERLPFFSIVLPEWFEGRFPNAVANLKQNAENRLTTPFDIHATMATLLTHFNKGIDTRAATIEPTPMPNLILRSLSLFEPIPAFRSCQDAAIDAHWCTCLRWQDADIENELVKKAAIVLVELINQINDVQRSQCAELKLKSINWAQTMTPNADLLAFKNSPDADGFSADLSGKTEIVQVSYQIQITLEPSEAIFETSMTYEVNSKRFTAKEHLISRVNLYGQQPHCVFDKWPQLRKYCFCVEQLGILDRDRTSN